MICFEIHRNTEKLCTAGVGQGVLSVIVNHLRSPKSGDDGFLDLHIGGIKQGEARSFEEVNWGGIRQLSVGDEVRIRIITADHCDEPTK